MSISKEIDYKGSVNKDRPNLQDLPQPKVNFKYDPYNVALPDNFISPYRVNYETNEICNMDCGFCFADYHEGVHAHQLQGTNEPIGQLHTSEVMAMMYQAAAMGTTQFLLGGGDPFIRKDTPELIEYGYAAGLQIVVDTNGLILAKREGLFERIAPLIHQLGLSLDGSTAETHNSFRETTPYSFERVMKLIELSRDKSYKLKINTIVTSANAHDIPNMVQTLAPYADVLDRWSLDQFIPVNRGKQNENKYTISDDEYFQVLNEVKQKADNIFNEHIFGGALKSQKAGTVMMFGPQGIPYVTAADKKRYIMKGIRTRPLHQLVTMAQTLDLDLKRMNNQRFSVNYYS